MSSTGGALARRLDVVDPSGDAARKYFNFIEAPAVALGGEAPEALADRRK
jgi:hypothetical protein